MLFSVPEAGWWLIALAATAVFACGMPVVADLTRRAEAARPTPEQRERTRGLRLSFYWATPVATGCALVSELVWPEPVPEILFLYSAALLALPVALLPLRPRLVRYHRDPRTTDIGVGALAAAWITGFPCVVILVSAAALAAR